MDRPPPQPGVPRRPAPPTSAPSPHRRTRLPRKRPDGESEGGGGGGIIGLIVGVVILNVLSSYFNWGWVFW